LRGPHLCCATLSHEHLLSGLPTAHPHDQKSQNNNESYCCNRASNRI
jgi:hypothetical protein